MILVRWETTPDDIHGLIQARGVLTAHGGMTSHAAVVARGMGKPCVAACEGLVDRRARRHGDDRRARRWSVGDVITIDGGTGRVIVGPVRLVPPAIDENFGTILGLGRRVPPPAGARERRHARGRGQGARVRSRGDRPLPHRAHVHGARSAADRAGDDHGRDRAGAARGARSAAARAAGRLRGDLRGDGRVPGDDPAARPAAARVPPVARGGDERRDAPADRRAARGESDARDARLPARAPVPRDLRDAGARDRAGRRGRRSAQRARRRSSRSCTRSSASARSWRGCAS